MPDLTRLQETSTPTDGVTGAGSSSAAAPAAARRPAVRQLSADGAEGPSFILDYGRLAGNSSRFTDAQT